MQEPESPPLSAASFQDAEPSVPEEEDEEEVDEHKSSTTEFDGPVKVVELVADHVREPTMRPCRALALTPPECCVAQTKQMGNFLWRGLGSVVTEVRKYFAPQIFCALCALLQRRNGGPSRDLGFSDSCIWLYLAQSGRLVAEGWNGTVSVVTGGEEEEEGWDPESPVITQWMSPKEGPLGERSNDGFPMAYTQAPPTLVLPNAEGLAEEEEGAGGGAGRVEREELVEGGEGGAPTDPTIQQERH